MPGILIQLVAFTGKDQQGVPECPASRARARANNFQHGDADIVGAGNHMRGRAYFVDLENRGFVVIALAALPRDGRRENMRRRKWCRRYPSWRRAPLRRRP